MAHANMDALFYALKNESLNFLSIFESVLFNKVVVLRTLIKIYHFSNHLIFI